MAALDPPFKSRAILSRESRQTQRFTRPGSGAALLASPPDVVLLWASTANAARYQQNMSGCFNTVTACGFTYPAVTRETLVLHVSCLIDLQKVIDPSLVFPVILSTPGATATPTASNWLRAAFVGGSPAFDGSGWYSVNAETYLFFAPGQTADRHFDRANNDLRGVSMHDLRGIGPGE
jgi:hypothetical protein